MPDKLSIRIGLVGHSCTMRSSLRALGLALLVPFVGSVVAASCGGAGGGGGGGGGGNGGSTGTGAGGSSGVAGNNAGGAGGSPGTGGAAGSAGGVTGSGGSVAGTNGGAGTGGVTGVGGSAGGAGGATGTGGGAAGTGGRGGTTGTAGTGGSGGAAGGTAGAGGRGGGTAGAGGRGGNAGGTTGTGGSGGATSCPGHALSLGANGTGQASDTAYAHVELTLGSDLPIGNAQRTIEFWAYIKTTDWVGELNQVYYYGTSGTAASLGLDFGTNPVMGMSGNHATLDPFTGGGFSDDSTNDLGINSSSNQWVHVAMVWNGTNLITYVNGVPKITTAGTGVTMLATGSSVLSLGCNPTNNNCFSGLFDELRIWKVARTATEIQNSYNKPVPTDSANLVGYWKFDETSGTTTADAVTTAGHTAHNGTLKAMATAQNPTFVAPPTPLPLVCP
jgi:hypothetical protein